MQWLLDYSENYRAQLRQGPFFTNLSRADRPNDLQWVHQLVHQSREFTQALCLRYSVCQDKRFQPVFAKHAVEEADHPDQLIAWTADWVARAMPSLNKPTKYEVRDGRY